jgi:hypothetical protein
MRHGAHHGPVYGLLHCSMRTALFELIEYLVNDAHCSVIHATPNKTIAAKPAKAAQCS